MKKTVGLFLLSLLLLLFFTACGKPHGSTSTSHETTAPGGTEDPASLTYPIKWMTKDGPVITEGRLGQVPTPPRIPETVQTASTVFTFTGWSETPAAIDLLPENEVVYTANYSSAPRKYDVTFTVRGKTVATASVEYGKTATAPDVEIEPGYRSVMWQGISSKISGDTVIEGMYTVLDGGQLEWCLTRPLLSFRTEQPGLSDIYSDSVKMSGVLLYAALEANASPAKNPALAIWVERAVEDLHNMVSAEDAAPFFDLEPYWCYVPLTAAIALCKETPAIWNALSALDREKLEFTMKCFAYIGALGTSDQNNYQTGPGLMGNFGKNWNPNYRLANVLPMVFVSQFFGGADQVDSILAAFDFDATVAKFDEYGFTRAKARWSIGAPQFEDGSFAPTNKQFMENGGIAYLADREDATGERMDIKAGTPAGTGAGVRVAYKYGGYRLNQVDKIFSLLFAYNYSGGAVFSTTADIAGGLDASGKPVCYILDGTVSPMEGEEGMMREFNCGDGGGVRSSGSYTCYDFIMINAALAASEAMGMYDIGKASNSAVLRMMLVGNTDFVYKYQHGYMSYSLGNAYRSVENDGDGYFLWKTWWHNRFGQITREDLPLVTDPGDSAGNTVLLDTDYTEDAFSFVGGPKETTAYAVNGLLEYLVRDRVGFTYTASGGILRILQAAGTADGGLNYEMQGGLSKIMGDADLLTLTLQLSREAGEDAVSSCFRLRGKNSTGNTFLVLFSTTEDGKVCLGGNAAQTVTTLTDSFQTITVSVDFRHGVMYAVCGSNRVEMPLTVPAGSTAATPAEWLPETQTSGFVFQWFMYANDGGSQRTLTVDSLRLEAGFAGEGGEGASEREIIAIPYTDASFNYTGGPAATTPYAVTDGVEYVVRNKDKISYITETKEGNTFLKFTQGAGSTDGCIKYETAGGLAGQMGSHSILVFRMDLAKGGESLFPTFDFRLRGKNAKGNSMLSLFTATADGDILLGGQEGQVVTRVGDSFVSLTFRLDLNTGNLAAYVGEAEAKSVTLSVPAVSDASDLLDWLPETKTSTFVFECYIHPNAGEADAVLLLDNLIVSCAK